MNFDPTNLDLDYIETMAICHTLHSMDEELDIDKAVDICNDTLVIAGFSNPSVNAQKIHRWLRNN